MLRKAVKNAVCFIAGNRFLLRVLEKRRAGKVIILMYHRIAEMTDSLGLVVNSHFFDEQMKYITDNYNLISLDQAVHLLEMDEIHGSHVAITFDDGYRDNLINAYPILKRYNAPATIFICCDAVEKGNIDLNLMDHAIMFSSSSFLDLEEFGLGIIPIETSIEKNLACINLRIFLKNADHSFRKLVIQHITSSSKEECPRAMLKWEEVEKLLKDGLVTIGAHTVSHPILSKISIEDARFEVFESKRIITEKTGFEVSLFAYPNGRSGDFDDKTVALVKAAGFKAACSTISGINIPGVNPFKLKRIDVTYGICKGIGGGFSPEMFGAYISGEYDILAGRA